MLDYIHEYVRERVPGKGRQIVGVIIGTVYNDTIVFGWSKVNWKEGDQFDKTYGCTRAMLRAIGQEPTPALPIQMHDQVAAFTNRCLAYFQQANYISVKGQYVQKEGVVATPFTMPVFVTKKQKENKAIAELKTEDIKNDEQVLSNDLRKSIEEVTKLLSRKLGINIPEDYWGIGMSY